MGMNVPYHFLTITVGPLLSPQKEDAMCQWVKKIYKYTGSNFTVLPDFNIFCSYIFLFTA